MKRQVLFFAILPLLMVASVSAQEKFTTASNDLPPQSDLITIQDDSTGNFLIFSISSGEYKFFRCKDQFALSGIGIVKLNGCLVSLEDVRQDRRVLVSADECTQIAKASVTLFVQITRFDTQPLKELLTDGDMRDSTTDCAPKIQPKF